MFNFLIPQKAGLFRSPFGPPVVESPERGIVVRGHSEPMSPADWDQLELAQRHGLFSMRTCDIFSIFPSIRVIGIA